MNSRGDDETGPGHVTGLLRDLADWLDRAEGDAGWLAALRFGVAGGLAEAGEAALAEGGFRRIVAENPYHLWSWVGLIEIARARGDPVAAIALGRDAMGLMPGEALLRRKTAEALEAAGDAAGALELMRAVAEAELSPGDGSFTIGLHRATGTVAEAAALCDQVLAARPDDEYAHLARIEVGLQADDGRAAVAAAKAALEHHPHHPEIQLRAAQAQWLAGDRAGALALAQNAPGDGPFLPWFLRLRAAVPRRWARSRPPGGSGRGCGTSTTPSLPPRPRRRWPACRAAPPR